VTLVLGVDPGAHGAFAVYDTISRTIVSIKDMPIWYQTISKKRRARIDGLAIADMFDVFEMMGVGLFVMEQVGGRSGQSASAGFAFGYGVGIIYMAGLYSGIPLETTPPSIWKKIMNVPGKTNASDDDIVARADELFPAARDLWRGPKGGKRVDRAEAAILAKFGADHVLGTVVMAARGDPEFELAYKNANTGA
jgi:hypothetical protein